MTAVKREVDLASLPTTDELCERVGVTQDEAAALQVMATLPESEPWFNRRDATKVSDAQVKRLVALKLVRSNRDGDRLSFTALGRKFLRIYDALALSRTIAAGIGSLGADGVQIGSTVYKPKGPA